MTKPDSNADIDQPELIRKFLAEENMKPSQLASALNVAETTVQRWLKGEAKPTGTAAAVLWTLIGLGGVVLGAAAPAAGLLTKASLAARLLRSASIGAGVITSGVGIYRLLKKRLDKADMDDDLEKALQEEIEAIREKERQEEKIRALREKLEEEEKRLKELEDRIAGRPPIDRD